MTVTTESRLGWAPLAEVDPDLWVAMLQERDRQRDKIELIASENYVFAAVMEAQGSWLTNKYAEGLPGKRYYGGCEYVDIAETLAQERALALFPGAEHVNVQPHSGAQANMAAYFSVLKPGDRILGMNLAHGGHLTHGSPVNFSGRLYEVHAYGVDRETERIDYDALEATAREVRPKMVVAGASAYPRILDFPRMAEIAHAVGALLFVDMAHIAGLVAAGVHPSPFPHADIVTTTTHKTLRGGRGGLIFSREALPDAVDPADFPSVKTTLAAQIDKAVFPGVQGGPLMHVIAGKAVGLKLAAEAPFKRDQERTVENAAVLADALAERGARIVSGGTDNHLMLVDVTPLGVTGKEAEALLDDVGITVNKNAIPFDPLPPNTASGIRLGTPATTTRGFGPEEMRAIARIVTTAIAQRDDTAASARLRAESAEIAARFPVPRPVRRGRRVIFAPSAESALPIIVAAFVVAALIALVATPVIVRIVGNLHLVDHPDSRRFHDRPLPRGGGVAVVVAFLLVGGGLVLLGSGLPGMPDPRSVQPDQLAGLFGGAILAAVIGAIDDRFDLRARWQFLGQLGLAGVAVAAGITVAFIGDPFGPGNIPFATPVGIAFTVVWIVGMINSLNFIDGLDGLSTGIALIAAVTLGLLSLTVQVNQPLVAVLCFALAGALLGFLRWNFHPAVIFQGTAGVMFLGYVLAVLAILGSAKVVVALLVLAVPIIDTFWVIVRRLSSRRSPFSPDRGHIHHRLLDLGLSHRSTVLLIYLVCATLGLMSLLVSSATGVLAFVVALVGFGVVAFVLRRDPTGAES